MVFDSGVVCEAAFLRCQRAVREGMVVGGACGMHFGAVSLGILRWCHLTFGAETYIV